MPTFSVSTKETAHGLYFVEASSKEEAEAKLLVGEAKCILFESINIDEIESVEEEV